MSSQIGVDPERQQINKFSVKTSYTGLFYIGQCSHNSLTPTVQVQQHVGLEQIFGPCHLTLRHTRAKRHPVGQQWQSTPEIWEFVQYISVLEHVLTIPSEWSASFPLWCRAHTPCRAPTGLCLCSRCWKTGSCGTGSPGKPSEPVYWTGSGVRRHNPTGTITTLRLHTYLAHLDIVW